MYVCVYIYIYTYSTPRQNRKTVFCELYVLFVSTRGKRLQYSAALSSFIRDMYRGERYTYHLSLSLYVYMYMHIHIYIYIYIHTHVYEVATSRKIVKRILDEERSSPNRQKLLEFVMETLEASVSMGPRTL